MTASPHKGFGEARKREHQMMSILADLACGRRNPEDFDGVEVLRQLGYSASLARGKVHDPNDRLGLTVRYCYDHVQGTPTPKKTFRDKVQERWGAGWHMDAVKLRKELPLHVMKLTRQECSERGKETCP